MYDKVWKHDKIAFGGDYNPEQWDEATWEEDMRLFRLAHIDTVTLNVFSWAALQPDENTYCFDKLDKIMNMARDNGLKVVLATATGAHPAWMAHRYPEILRTEFNGIKRKFGGRHNSCPNSLVYRKYSVRLAEKLAERYKDYDNVIAWHISNEYGGECYCENCEKAFRVWLKEKYKTLDELNRVWNTAFWGHTFYDWDEVVLPNLLSEHFEYDRTMFQGISLDYRRFNSDSILECYRMEYEEGEVLGEEARGRGKDVILGPGINIKRSPVCGRNFEYMSEDPYLISEMVVPMVKGIQKSDVAACVKHFAANSQETERLWVDTKVSERALQEIYFPGFQAAVKEGGAYSLMGAYNLLNGEHCCTSRKLLNGTLRGEWGFDGMVVSDWGGVHDTELAAESALDIEMDVTYDFDKHHMADALLEKVRAGELSESLIDEKVRNILRLMFRLKMIGEKKGERKSGTYNSRAHQDAVLEIARKSLILLKNEGDVLPLDAKKQKKIAVIGQNAAAIHSNGGGSAEIKALYEISPMLGMKKMLGGNAQVCYAPGYEIPGKGDAGSVNWQADKHEEELGCGFGGCGFKERGKRSESRRKRNRCGREYRQEALRLARECDTVIFIGGLNHDYDSEGYDRKDLTLPYGQDALIEELLAVKPDMVVVIYAGSPVAMPWKDRAKAILFSYYAGMEGGTAIAESLFGGVNPSGRLAESFIQSIGQCPAHTVGTFGKKDCVEYKEGVMVGYRHYDTVKEDVTFCFGHGLSYSRFVYKYMTVVPVTAQAMCGQNGAAVSGTEKECAAAVKEAQALYKISVTVKNDSERTGKEVVQVYVAPKEPGHSRPYHELRAFEKIGLEPGQEKVVKLLLTEQAFACYDEAQHAFVTKKGAYEIQVGSSSRDIRLRQQIMVF